MTFTSIVFDLDDTLLDTFGQLVPQASKEACLAMIEKGLAADLQACLRARDALAQTPARSRLFENLTAQLGVRTGIDPIVVAQSGFRAFYDRKVESDIALFAGAREMLHALRDRYSIHLVTAGHPDTQEEKLEILKIKPLFETVSIVNTFSNEQKYDAFERIQSLTGQEPARHLSVGNRLDTDLAPAKRLGWSTCWVRYGEYARSVPADADERPDFTIDRIQDLAMACRL